MRINVVRKEFTHEGAVASRLDPEQQLRRSVMACMLWEDTFYEDGKAIGERISELVAQVRPEFAAACAFHARTDMKLRHAPLLIVREMARLQKHKGLVARLLSDVIQRPDEMTEFLAIYWKDKRQPLSAQVKKGLARAFGKFNEYQLAKYDRDGQVKLRDVLFLSHSRPADKDAEKLYKKVVDRKLAVPDTWEVALSGGEDKKRAFERLMADGKLGALAFIRNLRNMKEAGVEKATVAEYADKVNIERVLPFRFIAAARACPGWEDVCDGMLFRLAATEPKLTGKTVVVVDISGSMYGYGNISKRSDMSRIDAAGALAAIAKEQGEDVRLYATAGDDGAQIHATAEMPPRRGMALVDVIAKRELASKLGGGGIFLHQCLSWIKEREHEADRLVVLTDEQDCDHKLKPQAADAFGKRNYLINVSVEKPGIGYKPQWTHIDGWSEAVLDYIREAESA